jgi:hypothetical protein
MTEKGDDEVNSSGAQCRGWENVIAYKAGIAGSAQNRQEFKMGGQVGNRSYNHKIRDWRICNRNRELIKSGSNIQVPPALGGTRRWNRSYVNFKNIGKRVLILEKIMHK